MNPHSAGRLNRVIDIDDNDDSARPAHADPVRRAPVQSSRTEKTPPRSRPFPVEGAPGAPGSQPSVGGGAESEERRNIERLCLRAEREGAAGWVKVIPRLRAYLEAVPRDAQAWAFLARARASQGEDSEAARAAQEAIRLDPNASLGHVVNAIVARSAAKAGRWDSVQKHAEAALASHPSDPEALELLVWALASRQQLQKAEETLGVLSQANPERAAAVAKKLAQRASGTQERYRWLCRSCQWGRGAERPLQELAEVCLVLERATEAHQWYREYFTQKGGACEPEVTSTLVQLCVRFGRNEESVEVYRKALKATPDRFELYRDFGQHLVKQSRASEAIDIARQGSGLAPSLQEAAQMHVMVAELQQNLGNTREALKAWEAATALDDSNVQAWRGLHSTASSAGNEAEQARALKQLARLEPHSSEWSSKLSSVQHGTDDRHSRSDDHSSVIRKAVVALQEFNAGEALHVLERVEQPSQEVQAWLGYTQLLLGNTDKAIVSLQAAKRHSVVDPRTRLYLALALDDSRDDKAAKHEFASAARTHPTLQRVHVDQALQDALRSKNLEKAGLASDFPGAGQRLVGRVAILALGLLEGGATSDESRTSGNAAGSRGGVTGKSPTRRDRALQAAEASDSNPESWRDTLQENQAVEVYSKSAVKWLNGKVKQVMPQMVKVKYLIDGQWCEKVLLRNSDSLRIVNEAPDSSTASQGSSGGKELSFAPPTRTEEAQSAVVSAASGLVGLMEQVADFPKGVVQMITGSSETPEPPKDTSAARTLTPKRADNRSKTWAPEKNKAPGEDPEARRGHEKEVSKSPRAPDQPPQPLPSTHSMPDPRRPASDKCVTEHPTASSAARAVTDRSRTDKVPEAEHRPAKSPVQRHRTEATGRLQEAYANISRDKSPRRPDVSSAPLASLRDKSPRRPEGSHVAGHGKVMVTVVSASDLMAADVNGKSDPYCKCRVRGHPSSEFKTEVIKKELNPVWNCKQHVPAAVPGSTLEFEVFDWDRFTKDDPLGKAKLELGTDPCGPEESFEVELALGGVQGAKGSLKVKLIGVRPAARTQEKAFRPAASNKSVVEGPEGGKSPRQYSAQASGTTPRGEEKGIKATPALGAQPRQTTNVKGIEVENDELLSIDELHIGKKLGTGGFGAVFQGRYRGQEVAVKKLHIADGQVTAQQVEEFKKEVACLQALRHLRLVSFIGAALQPPHSLCIVTEFMPNGSLYDLLHQRKQKMEWQKRAGIATQVVEGVEFLHSRSPPFVHRDLKSLNVVMDFALNAKLCDFGLTQSMEKTHISRRDNEGGSPRYMAPELFDSKGKITEKVDIWATGALVLEVFTSRLPHEECTTLQQVMTKTLVERKMPFLDWKDVAPDLRMLAERCFEFQPQRRIDATNLLEGLRSLRPG